MNTLPQLLNPNTEEIVSDQTENELLEIIEPEAEDYCVAIPYVGNLSNKIAGILRRKLKWKLTFTPGVKVLHMLKSIKDKEEHPPPTPSIYEIPCEKCTYIGETELSCRKLGK